MSYNRLRYDDCAYKENLKDNKSTEKYSFFFNKFENRKCFNSTLPNTVSLVDRTVTESELHGLNRLTSRCTTKKFSPVTNSYKNPKFIPNRVCDNAYRLPHIK